MSESYKYAVVTTYSFDDTTTAFGFYDEPNAKRFLQEQWSAEVENDKENSKYPMECHIDDDRCYAYIENHRPHEDDLTEWYLVKLIDPPAEFLQKGETK